MRAILLLTFCAALTGCPKPSPVPVNPMPDADAAVAPGVSCATACAQGARIGCAWARPTAAGASCEAVCANANRPDGPLRWSLACRTNTLDCNACP